MVDTNASDLKSLTLGWIGFGKMGIAAAGKLVEAGYTVHGYNRTPDKVKSVHHVTPVSSIQELVKSCDIIFSTLSADQAVKQTYDQIIPHIRSNQIYIEMSTIHPDTVVSIAKQVESRHAHILDCPISGSPASIAKGAASIIAGGDSATFNKVKPLLAVIAPSAQQLMGSNGKGQVMKLSINLHLGIQVAASAESVALCESYGIDKDAALHALLNSAAASGHMKYRSPYIAKLPDQALFTTSMMNKDYRLVQQLAQSKNLPLPMTSVAQTQCIATESKGYGEQDFAAMYPSCYADYVKKQ